MKNIGVDPILKDIVKHNDRLQQIEPDYIVWNPGVDLHVILDGRFSSPMLRALADHMDMIEARRAKPS